MSLCIGCLVRERSSSALAMAIAFSAVYIGPYPTSLISAHLATWFAVWLGF
ncbi:hypothetical protein [Vulcanisaeta sp. JCM 14467]